MQFAAVPITMGAKTDKNNPFHGKFGIAYVDQFLLCNDVCCVLQLFGITQQLHGVMRTYTYQRVAGGREKPVQRGVAEIRGFKY